MAQMKAYIMPMKKITLICNLVHLPKEFQNWVVCFWYQKSTKKSFGQYQYTPYNYEILSEGERADKWV